MKNKFLILMLVFCVLFMNLGKVLAEGIIDVNAKFIEYIDDIDYSISDTDGKITISLTNPTYGYYTMEFNETNDTITYVNTRDVSSVSDVEKIYYASVDDYFITAMILTLFDVYNVDLDSLPEDIDYEAMGITYQHGDEIVYESDGLSIRVSPFTSISFNLTEFDNYTKNFQGDVDNSEKIAQMLTFMKAFSNPMTESILSNDFVNDVDGAFDNVDDFEIEDAEPDSNMAEISNISQKVKVPPTSASAQYIMLGIFAFAVAVGMSIYVVFLKK